MTDMKPYRKKPVVISAVQVTDTNAAEIVKTINGPAVLNHGGPGLYIDTMEGLIRADPGDFIIRGVAGEFYPCKPDIFHQTYEEATND